MSLQHSRLEKVRELGNGVVQARCPACAEGGQDRSGEHLRIYSDGRFGCCVHPKDREHRKRIFALAGESQRLGPSSRTFKVRVAERQTNAVSVLSVKDSLSNYVRTVRTGNSESVSKAEGLCEAESLAALSFRTLRTPISNPRAHRRGNELQDTSTYTCKDSESGVLPVLALAGSHKEEVSVTLEKEAANPPKERLPHFTVGGTLVIPFDSPEKFHWWRGGQSVSETRAQVLADGHNKTKGEIYADDF